MRYLRLLPALIAASLLAACNSGGGSGLPSTTNNAAPDAGSRASAPVAGFSLIENGTANPSVHIMGTIGSPLYARGAATTRGLLPYNNGLVETSAKFAVVYWGSSDPDGMQTRLNSFVGAVGGSAWLSTTKQYYQIVHGKKTHIGNPSGNFVGSWIDTANAVPQYPTQSQIAGEAARAAQHFGMSGVQFSVVVATEHGHNSSGFGSSFCAYHGSSGTLVYTNLPYMPDAGANCGANIINKGSTGILDGVTIVAGHELAEAQTDPLPPTGWSGNNGEIGDLCAWTNIQNTSFGSQTFPTQPLYSDAKQACEQ
ncbi:MAG: hypothetical protein M3R51_05100 [Candidatus Eremiobacteraeota bacterium]|nr:hypothetical protein [Candidatus Eremiobacteraeota bacterium]